MLAILNYVREWPLLTECLDRNEWLEDPRFSTQEARKANTGELVTLMEEIFVTADWADWLTRFTKAGITFGPIARSDDHLECPQVAANGMLPEMEGAGGMRTVDSPICIAGEKKTPPRRAPEIGEHTREILASMGIAGAEIDRIIASGAARA